jgi:Zn-finger protein
MCLQQAYLAKAHQPGRDLPDILLHNLNLRRLSMENSYRFFNNQSCKYFPCHKMPGKEDFNCLFCYCPLYSLGDGCGGDFTYNKTKTVKICMDCHLPHLPEFYDVIVERLSEKKVLPFNHE